MVLIHNRCGIYSSHCLRDAPRKMRSLPGPETWQPGGVQGDRRRGILRHGIVESKMAPLFAF
jgi:hypothetical protein